MAAGTDSFANRSLRQKLGGRWAISWHSYLITTALAFISLLAGEPGATESWDSTVGWVGSAGLASAVIGISILILDSTLLRNRRTQPVSIWVVVAINSACGALFGLIVGIGAGAWGLPVALAVGPRVVLDALCAAWWGPVLTLFLDYREHSRIQREELIASALQAEFVRIDQVELVDRLRQQLQREVDDELSPTLRQLESQLAEESDRIRPPDSSGAIDWHRTSELLRDAAANSIRPLSKRLWAEQSENYPRPRWWALPANIINNQPFRPLLCVMVDVAGTALTQFKLFGLERGIILTLVVVSVIFAVMIGANTLMRVYPAHHAAIYVVGLIASQMALVARVQLREAWVPGSAPAAWQITQLVVGVIVVVGTSGFGALKERQLEMRANFAETLRKDQITSIATSRHLAGMAREAAETLHGALQTRLVACSIAIEQAGARGDQSGVHAAMREAVAVLAQPLPDRPISGNVANEVARKVALWDGLCQFELSIDPDVGGITGADVVRIGRLVEEAIANSIRHGGASTIEIDLVSMPPHSVQLTVSDNGCGPTSGTPGIGSALMHQASAGNWSLATVAEGAQLQALIRLA